METNQNPLDIDLSSVKTTMPLIQGPQDLVLKVEKSELVSGKNNPQARMLSLELSTTGPTSSVDGSMVGPGARVFHRENVVPVGKLKPEQIIKGLGSIVQCFGLANVTLGTIDMWHKQLEGRTGKCRVIIEPEQSKDGKNYPAKNSISAFKKAN